MARKLFEPLLEGSIPDDIPKRHPVIDDFEHRGFQQWESRSQFSGLPWDPRSGRFTSMQLDKNMFLSDTGSIPKLSYDELRWLREANLQMQHKLLSYQKKRYAVVLIDGNVFCFSNMASAGSGKDCAEALLDAVRSLSYFSDTRIRIYASLGELSKSLNIEKAVLLDFACAFNSHSHQCSFILNDSGIERTQCQIESVLKTEMEMDQCGSIVLGIPLNRNEYRTTLHQISLHAPDRSRLILLKNPSCCEDMKDLQRSFDTTVFAKEVLQPIEGIRPNGPEHGSHNIVTAVGHNDLDKGDSEVLSTADMVESFNAKNMPMTPAISLKNTPNLANILPVRSDTWASRAAPTPPPESTPRSNITSTEVMSNRIDTLTSSDAPSSTSKKSSIAPIKIVAEPPRNSDFPELSSTARMSNTPAKLMKSPSPMMKVLDFPSLPATPKTAIVKSPTKPVAAAVIERNKKGERIDRMDQTIPYREISRMKNMKLCNIYYLHGPDQCDGDCKHSHAYKLANSEKPILREVARMTPCRYRTGCSEPGCIYGHRCPQSKVNEKDCYYGTNCRFYGWGHGIDTRVAEAKKV